MKDFLTTQIYANFAIIVTALLSLLGVLTAAILTYRSNVKMNQSKIQLEERKARYPYLKESFDELRNAQKRLEELESKVTPVNSSVKTRIKLGDEIMKLLLEVEPYLISSDKDNLMKLSQEIDDKVAVVQTHYVKKEKTENKEILDILAQMEELKFSLKKALSKDASMIADILRKYIIE